MSDWLKQLKNPPAAFRGAPFWAWNSRLEKAELVRQVSEFQRAGLGGFFMHVRYGLETEYLSAEFLDCIKAVVAEAKKRKMEAWLYDEDRWPSGFAGGLVTRDPKFCIKYLAVEQVPAANFTAPPPDAVRCFTAKVKGNRASDIAPLPLGQTPAPGDGRVVLVYRACTTQGVGWFNNTANVDSMNPEAIQAFIAATHEAYKRAVGEEFGRTVPGIFTDEPNIGHFNTWGKEREWAVPWTDRLTAEFRRRFGYDLLDHLVELTFDIDGAGPSIARHDYRRCVTELYTEAYSKQIGQWCAANGLEFTGHELWEQPLSGQIDQVGACMPHYEWFGRPAIDILMDREPEVLTAKQCVSAASQLGRPRVLSELFGCTGWDATFEMYKHIGDWHQVLGINSFCPHLSWYSMAGGAKRDYPAGIFYQSPWWPDHKLLADYFARLSLALSQGRAVREIAVIHPIESAWLVHKRQDPAASNALSESLNRLSFDLLDRQLDFDFADESLLAKYGAVKLRAGPETGSVCHPERSERSPRDASRPEVLRCAQNDTLEARGHASLKVGQMSYRAVIVPESLTLRASTVELLEKFAAAGGTLVFVGDRPTLMDCRPSDRPGKLAAQAACVPHSIAAISAALGDSCRPVEVRNLHWNRADIIAWTHLRKTDEGELLFVHHRDRQKGAAAVIRWAGEGRVREIDALTGKISDVAGVQFRDGRQQFVTELASTGSRLFLRTPGVSKTATARQGEPPAEVARIPLAPIWDFQLDEPNGLNLDYCRLKIVGQDAAWRPRKLIWQHERDLRKELGFRDNAHPAEQPYIWMRKLSPKSATVEVEFEIQVEAAPAGPVSLVIEHPERFDVLVNGKQVHAADVEAGLVVASGRAQDPPLQGASQLKDNEWFIDRSFRVVPLAGVKFKKGVNKLLLRTEYREHHWLEEVYLIGKFGVRTAGDRAFVAPLPKKLAVGDWCGQGLAMYSGAVTYRQAVRVGRLAKGQRVVLCLDRPKATVIRVAVNGKPVGTLGWQPWRIDITAAVKQGVANKIEITLVSSRRNLLGPLHFAVKNPSWTGPAEFRAESPETFTPNYNLVPYGLLGEAHLEVLK